MKRIITLLLITLILLPAVKLFALDNPIEDYLTFRITPQFEVANGVINEYVFDPECKNTDNKLSQLDWNVSTVSLFNLQADFDIIKYISLGLSASFGVPQRSGFMQDSDWRNSTTAIWKGDDPTERTDFSEHINKLDKYINFKIDLGGNLYLPLEFKLTPHISYQYEFIKFTGWYGYGEYKPYDGGEELTKISFSEKVISYEQESNSVFAGLKLISTFIPHTFIQLNFDLSPKLTFINAIDYHYPTQQYGDVGTAFWDKFKNILQIQTGLTAQYSFTKNHSAGFAGKIQYIPLSKGDTSQTAIDKKGNFTTNNWQSIDSGNGGTERFIWSLCLNYSFSL